MGASQIDDCLYRDAELAKLLNHPPSIRANTIWKAEIPAASPLPLLKGEIEREPSSSLPSPGIVEGRFEAQNLYMASPNS
jgi:hypothetical protein